MGKTVLIVEDDPKSMKLIRDILSAKGYDTVEASDGKRGVELARLVRPDLVLMDIMMPGVDGYAACYEIKSDEFIGKTPVIMVTALGFDLNKALAQRLGADGYITKPFSPVQLLDAVSNYLSSS